MSTEQPVFSPSEFVAVLNQSLEYAYPSVLVAGELANLRVSKNRWVYFDVKDDNATVKCFGTVYQLPGPLEDGLMIQVQAQPRLHPLYGFSLNIQYLQPVGQGAIKRAAELLFEKLKVEGLFEEARKRPIPYPPNHVGLITSGQSAAYHDFVKILNERWGGMTISLADVQVQGEPAVGQIARAINYFNSHATPPDVLVITRGGGSADDLAVFNTEQVTRAVAASRIPTLVAIGHEVDVSLSELAADQRASTPSNAAELLVPDKKQVSRELNMIEDRLGRLLSGYVREMTHVLERQKRELVVGMDDTLARAHQVLELRRRLLGSLSPAAIFDRGFAVVRKKGKAIKSAREVLPKDTVTLVFKDTSVQAEIKE